VKVAMWRLPDRILLAVSNTDAAAKDAVINSILINSA
jgi:hypothetical protein